MHKLKLRYLEAWSNHHWCSKFSCWKMVRKCVRMKVKIKNVSNKPWFLFEISCFSQPISISPTSNEE